MDCATGSGGRGPGEVESVGGGRDLGYRINHPAVMRTAVYLDEAGTYST